MSDELHGLPGEKYSENPPLSPSLQRASHESPASPSFIWPDTQSPTYPDQQPTPLHNRASSQLPMIFGFGILLLLAGIGIYTIIASHVHISNAPISARATQSATQAIEMNTATATSKPVPTATTISSGAYPPPATHLPTATPLHAPTATPTIINKSLYVAANNPPNGVDTGIYLLQGMHVSIQSSGLGAYFGIDPHLIQDTCVQNTYLPYTDPDGNRYPDQNKSATCVAGFDATATLPAKPVGTLLGRIGTGGAWFSVGSSSDFAASQNGELFLVYNDSASNGYGYNDNSGGYATSIHVTSA